MLQQAGSIGLVNGGESGRMDTGPALDWQRAGTVAEEAFARWSHEGECASKKGKDKMGN